MRQFLLDISGQLAPGKLFQRRNGVRLGVSSQGGGNLKACQLEHGGDAPLRQIAQRTHLPLGFRREKERLDMDLEMGSTVTLGAAICLCIARRSRSVTRKAGNRPRDGSIGVSVFRFT